jgi:hypothetical protein
MPTVPVGRVLRSESERGDMTRLRGAFPPVVSAVGSIDPVIDHEPASVRALVASEPRTAARQPLEEQQG